MLHSMIFDDFLADFDRWRAFADAAKFEDVVNPVDAVVYPGISDLSIFYESITQRLRRVLGRTVKINHLFMRLSVEGVTPPHWAHHDGSMGEYSMMVYLNRAEHCQGGTALLRHRDGDPTPEMWERDTNEPRQWEFLSVCDMQPNRAFIFRSELWHAALPGSGFGKDATDGRLVLTCFFA